MLGPDLALPLPTLGRAPPSASGSPQPPSTATHCHQGTPEQGTPEQAPSAQHQSPALLPTEEKSPGLQWWKRLENWNRTRSRSWVSPLSTSAWRKLLEEARIRTGPGWTAGPGLGQGLPGHPSSPGRAQALPKGPVQALAAELEEGQVLLSHSPAEVIAVEGSGNHVWVRSGQEAQAQGEPQACTSQGLGIGTGDPKQGKGPASQTLGPERARDSQGLICSGPRLMLGGRPHVIRAGRQSGQSNGSKLGQVCGEGVTPV